MSDGHNPASYDPGRDFWKEFVDRYWGRRPAVIRQPFAHAIASPEDVFGAMVAATNRLRADTQDFVLTIDGVRVGADVERWLPRKKDRSLGRLTARMAGDLPGSSFAVFIRAFQLELGWDFWLRVRHFLSGLYATVGVPADRAEIDLFAGTYERSRHGIHLDSADVFLFVIEGRKRIRLWPGSVFPDGNYWYGRGEKDRRLSRSSVLDGEPGDILYWPSSYWHVGESRGGPVSSLSLGLYRQDSLAATAARVFADEATRELGADNFIDSLASSVERLRAASPRALRALDRASGNLAQALLRRRMEQVTGYAFEHVPQPSAPRRLRASSLYAADPAFPIVCRSVGDTAIVAANGRSTVLPRSKAVQQMIDSLNRGTPISLSHANGAARSDAREALRFLLVSGAVEPSRARGGASRASRAR